MAESLIARVRLADGQVLEMDPEEYLRGVVPAEMSASKPMDALCAQAVAARSFLVARLTTNFRHTIGGQHVVCTTTCCQVYNPDKGHDRSDEAIAATAGLVLAYRGRIAQAFYSARCGGVTLPAWVPEAAPWCKPRVCLCGSAYPGRPRNGHGRGLCQVGAYLMADQGYSWQEILHHYYSGVEIVSLAELLGIQPEGTG